MRMVWLVLMLLSLFGAFAVPTPGLLALCLFLLLVSSFAFVVGLVQARIEDRSRPEEFLASASDLLGQHRGAGTAPARPAARTAAGPSGAAPVRPAPHAVVGPPQAPGAARPAAARPVVSSGGEAPNPGAPLRPPAPKRPAPPTED